MVPKPEGRGKVEEFAQSDAWLRMFQGGGYILPGMRARKEYGGCNETAGGLVDGAAGRPLPGELLGRCRVATKFPPDIPELAEQTPIGGGRSGRECIGQELGRTHEEGISFQRAVPGENMAG